MELMQLRDNERTVIVVKGRLLDQRALHHSIHASERACILEQLLLLRTASFQALQVLL